MSDDGDRGRTGAQVVALAARAAGRRAVTGPRDPGPLVPRQRTVVPTGPAGQRALRRRLQQRLDQVEQADVVESGFSVAVVEVDPADSRHPDGRERLLAALGSRLADATRPSDLVVRPGRDRFVLVLGGTRDSYGLAAARRRISDVLSRPVLIDGRPVRSTVAVGLVPATAGDTVEALMGRLSGAAVRDARPIRRLRSLGTVDAPA